MICEKVNAKSILSIARGQIGYSDVKLMESDCDWRKYICYSNDDGDNNKENKTKICLFFETKSLSVRQILKNNSQNFPKQ